MAIRYILKVTGKSFVSWHLEVEERGRVFQTVVIFSIVNSLLDWNYIQFRILKVWFSLIFHDIAVRSRWPALPFSLDYS